MTSIFGFLSLQIQYLDQLQKQSGSPQQQLARLAIKTFAAAACFAPATFRLPSAAHR